MTGRQALLLGTSLVTALLFWQRGTAAVVVGSPIVRIAELEIDPGQLEAYKLALKEEIETSIRVEPGVLTLYAVSLREHPEQIRIVRNLSGCSCIRIAFAESALQNIQRADAADGERS